ncbi:MULTISPECIES: hypothetical protein [Psychrobacter]|uniref:hypothetical protein n=1 Tax=Psychrobacter TaxID=497 RepID=UPI00146BF1E1|nr:MULTISPECIES: hypothetical protein [Psychrobacter]
MSSYSFSHQFYQRWTQTPEFIRSAIVQELADIATLLQFDTELQSHQFTVDDLDAHLNTLYQKHLEAENKRRLDAEQQEKRRLIDQENQDREARRQKRDQAERAAIEKAAKDKQRREQEKAEAQSKEQPQDLTADPAETTATENLDDQAAAKKDDLKATDEVKTESQALTADDVDALFDDIITQNHSGNLQENQAENNDKVEAAEQASQTSEPNETKHEVTEIVESLTTENDADKSNKNKDVEASNAHDDQQEQPLADITEPNDQAPRKNVPESLSITAKTADELTQALSNHLDDFLTDNMMQLSEDLKVWLKEEVSRQLAKINANNKQDQN